jgi:uncharacterized protein (TIRG00374 family)
MKNSKVLKNTFVALLISIITIFVIFSFLGLNELLRVLNTKNLYIITFSFSIFFCVILVDSFRSVIVSKTLGFKIKFFPALRNSILFYFISDITPLAAGGQPYQIYHYKKYGLSGTHSTNIVLSRFVEYIFTSTIVGFFAYIYLRSIGLIGLIGNGSSLFLIAFLFSMASGIFILIPMVYPKFLIYLSKLANLKFVSFLLKKFKIDPDDIQSKTEENVKKFDDSIKSLWRENFKIMVVDISLGVLDIFLQVLSLYVVFNWFGITPPFLNVFGIFVLLNLIVYYVPTPGASGGLESVYFLIFSNFLNIKSNLVLSSILVWRISTFYLIIALGFITFIIENSLKGVDNENSSTDSNI